MIYQIIRFGVSNLINGNNLEFCIYLLLVIKRNIR